MKKRPLHIACFIFLMTALAGYPTAALAQIETQLRKQFTDYSQTVIHENIFVHSDKDLYIAGEICWFKIYCVDALFHRPLSISKLAYWELLDRQNKPLGQLKIGLQDGFGNGSFALPATINSGVYRIRCYTNWMKNFDAGFYFEKEITVINPHQYRDKDTLKQDRTSSIRFFPEGGNLVNGIPGTVAFKIYGPDNRGLNGHGYLIDDANDTLQAIKTVRMGLGRFVFTPQSNRSYKAVLLLPGGEEITANLPVAFEEGYVMHVSDTGSNDLRVTVQTRGNMPLSGMVYLFVHTRASVKMAVGSPVRNNQALFILDKNALDDGISHITIFDAGRDPVCERLYFKYPTHDLTVRVLSNKETYATREKIDAIVETAVDSGDRAANLSMAVYKIDTLQTADKMNIENYLWLSADLPESVDSPEYYFDPANQDRTLAIDNLLLTQGWRRFRWDDVLHGNKPLFQFLPEYTGHIIEASILDSATRLPAGKKGVFVSSPGARPVFNAATSDSNGRLRFDMKDFYTADQLFVSPANLDDSNLSIDIHSPFSGSFSRRPLSLFSFSHTDTGALTEYNKDLVVQREFARSPSDTFSLPVTDTLPFYGKPDVSYRLDDYVRFSTMEEVLREYVAQTNVRYRDGRFEVSVWDRRRGQTLLEPAPLVLLDGVPTEINKVIRYDPLKVKRLDIVTENYYYGNMAFGGILSFTTYDGNLPGFELDPHTIVLDYAGLEAQREFSSAAYNTPAEIASRLPDFRRLLYWQPTIITDKQGRNTQSFYASDLPGKYLLVVQGVSSGGKVGYAATMFTVAGK